MTASPDRAGLLREMDAMYVSGHPLRGHSRERQLGWDEAIATVRALAATGDSEGPPHPHDGHTGSMGNCAICHPATGDSEGPGLDALLQAMNDAYTYEDRDNAVPTLPFVDDVEAFWRPFAEKVAARLSSGDAPVPEGEREGEPKP